MMSLKLIPNVEVELPLTAYYGVTLVSLSIGNSGITSCIVKIGDKDFEFRADAGIGTPDTLYVDGVPDHNPTYRLLSQKEKVKLLLPDTVAAHIGDQDIILNHYLSYSVPRDKQDR